MQPSNNDSGNEKTTSEQKPVRDAAPHKVKTTKAVSTWEGKEVKMPDGTTAKFGMDSLDQPNTMKNVKKG